MKPVPEIGLTLSEGVGVVKPHGLSRMVMIVSHLSKLHMEQADL